VWKRSKQLGDEGFTIILHGKAKHEETRATFSHSIQQAPTVVVFDKHEAMKLADIIREKYDHRAFFEVFGRTCSEGFDPDSHLQRLGVVNQTTMLASETGEITRIIKQALIDKYGSDQINHHFADTSDTLCYATNENQNATYALIEQGADISIVVGGYNSSNTSHLVELCQRSMPTYFIKNAQEIDSKEKIKHYDLRERNMMVSDAWLPDKRPLDIILTCGASCPDAVVDEVLLRILRFFPDASGVE
jgi:4-hydroxy-3-methylbut-2-enyl diphosphate reductase